MAGRVASMPSHHPTSLTIVGTGIAVGAHTTLEARLAIEGADHLLAVPSDPVCAAWLTRRHAAGWEDLRACYRAGRPRREAYAAMVSRVMAALAGGGRVVWAAYGHPGVFAGACHDAIAAARAAGYRARLQPGVGADACIWADLDLDPGRDGVAQWEATSFLLREAVWDPRALLVLWQVGAIGRLDWQPGGWDARRGLEALSRRLLAAYPPEHRVCLYEASITPVVRPRADWVPLAYLPVAPTSTATTLVVPPLPAGRWSADIAGELGLSDSDSRAAQQG